MARRSGRGRNPSRLRLSQRLTETPPRSGHDIPRQFTSDSAASRTSPAPLSPTSAQLRRDRNLGLAHAGDDSLLLPYRPTNTINPQRPRTLSAGYDAENEVLFVRFRDGAGYEYHDVTRSQWRQFKSTPSPGRYINAELNRHPYNPADW